VNYPNGYVTEIKSLLGDSESKPT